MKDRVPTQVLENGAIRYAVYDANGNFLRHEYLLPADDPTEAGTPLNKQTMLQDKTAKKLGLMQEDPTVDDAFSILLVPQIVVSTSKGATVTATKGSLFVSASSGASGTAVLPVSDYGTWTVEASLDGETASKTVLVNAVKQYEFVMFVGTVFGVCWNYSNPSTALERVNPLTDPNGVATNMVVEEPVAAVGLTGGSSPFDSISPWKDMDEYNIINNAVSYKRGAAGFSRTDYDTMVYIPPFYYRVINNATNSKRYYYVSSAQKSGFTKHPGSGRYIGRYTTGSGYVSKSALPPLASISRAAARTGSRGRGSKWYQYDFMSYCAWILLYLVEYADWDAQSKVGRGVVDGNSSAIMSGVTDAMEYHTGRKESTSGKTAVQYRHIENPWGNVFQWVDGINFYNQSVFICTNPANYADDTNANYTDLAQRVAGNGYIKTLPVPPLASWTFVPTSVGGSETTYVPDYTYYSNGWRVLCVGGRWGSGSNAGPLCFGGSDGSSDAGGGIGARLLYVP